MHRSANAVANAGAVATSSGRDFGYCVATLTGGHVGLQANELSVTGDFPSRALAREPPRVLLRMLQQSRLPALV